MRLTEEQYRTIMTGITAQKAIRSPEAQGYSDYWNHGGSDKQNPYKTNTPEARQWFRGWLAAYRDEKEAGK